MTIPEGTHILLYHGDRDRHLLSYQPGMTFSSRKGKIVFPPDLTWGSCLYSSKGVPFFVLRPTHAEQTLKVRRRTTIMYPKDMGWMLLHSNICPGMEVLECGSGSGAMTVFLALMVGEQGKVHSVERRKEHLSLAQENVRRYGLEDQVIFYAMDPVEEGFPKVKVETVIIDVPEPWTLVPPVLSILEPGGHWLSLSPTYNQVEKTWESLINHGFVALHTVEVVERALKVHAGRTRPREIGITHTAFLTHARLSRE